LVIGFSNELNPLNTAVNEQRDAIFGPSNWYNNSEVIKQIRTYSTCRVIAMALRCGLCDASFARGDNLRRHVKEHHHDADDDDWRAMEVDIRRFNDYKKLPATLVDDEAECVGLGSDSCKFTCLLCDPPKNILKDRARRHFEQKHDRKFANMKDWVLIVDANNMRAGFTENVYLETYFPNDAEEETAGGEQPQESSPPPPRPEPAAAQSSSAPSSWQPPPPAVRTSTASAAAPAPTQEVQTHLTLSPEHLKLLELAASAAPTPLSVTPQRLVISPNVSAWMLSDKDKAANRIGNFPQTALTIVPADVNLAGLEDYMTRVATDTRREYVKVLQKFIACMETTTGDAVDVEALLVSAYRFNFFEQLFQTNLWSADRSWTRKLSYAMKHFVDWQIDMFRRRSDREGENIVHIMKDGIFKALKHEANQAKTSADNLKNEKDATTLENVAPATAWHEAVTQAMVDLWVIWDHFVNQLEGQALPPRARQVVNVLIIGILFLNQLAGRPGEWTFLTAAYVRETISAFANDVVKSFPLCFLICKKYKNCKKYGNLGKWLAEGTQAALMLYMGLPGKRTPWLLEPALEKAVAKSEKASVVGIASLLHGFQRSVLSEWSSLTPTGVRKHIHTEADDTRMAKKALEFVNEFERHLGSTGKKYYVTRNPKSDARKQQLLFEKFMGVPAEWPSKEEIDKRRRPYEEVIAKTAHAEEDDEEAEDEEGELEDGGEAEVEDLGLKRKRKE
jgi:hypothetical protein